MKARLLSLLVAVLMLGGCATTHQRVLDTGSQSQLQMRSYQSRVFDTSDRERVLRVIIATLQDLGFVIERADLALGTVSATRLDGNTTRVTVSVQPRPGARTLRPRQCPVQRHAGRGSDPLPELLCGAFEIAVPCRSRRGLEGMPASAIGYRPRA